MKKKNKPQPEEEALYKRFTKWYDDVNVRQSYIKGLNEEAKRQLGEAMLKRIREKTGTATDRYPLKEVKLKWKSVIYYAAMIACVTTACVIYFSMSKQVTYQTTYGEIRAINLPDGSIVSLNGNSKLIFQPSLFSTHREVWLNGEAAFQVVHTSRHQRFSVHVSDSTVIEVLGTEFNVSNRTKRTVVALRKGKIALQYRSQANKQRISMKPGEFFLLAQNSTSYQLKKNANIDDFFFWQKHKLILNRTSLAYVLNSLADTHGLKLAAADIKLLQRSASGSLPLAVNQSEMLSNIALLYDLNIITTNGRSLIYAKE